MSENKSEREQLDRLASRVSPATLLATIAGYMCMAPPHTLSSAPPKRGGKKRKKNGRYYVRQKKSR